MFCDSVRSGATAVTGAELDVRPGTDGARYHVRGPLGAGAMGEVHRAHDAQLGHEVALKRMRVTNPESSARLKAEFRARSDLHHPNLLQVFDLVVDNEGAFFTMEIIEGVRLMAWVEELVAANSAPLGIGAQRVAAVIAPVVGALAALHEAGLVHRDVKPDNIMIEAGGRPVLADLGLAVGFIAEAGRPSRPPLRAGTPSYMAPEVMLRRPPTPASDMYSVGAVLRDAMFALARQRGAADTAVPGSYPDLIAALLDPRPDRRPSARDTEARLCAVVGMPAPPRPATFKRAAGRESFVGRREPLAAAVAAMRAPRPTAAIHVHGPSGIGKSAFVARLLEELADVCPELRVLRGRCRRHEQVAFRGLEGVIDDLAVHLQQSEHGVTLDESATRSLLRLFPILPLKPRPAESDATPPDLHLRRAAFEGLRTLLDAVARCQPIVVWLDDLQWAGDDTLDLLSWLMSGDGIAGCTMVFTYRLDDDARAHLRALRAALDRPSPCEPREFDIALPPLDDAEISELLRRSAPRMTASAAALAQLARDTEGYPIFARMLAYHDASPPAQTIAAGGMQMRLDALINSTIEALSPEQRALMDALCVAPAPIPLAVAARAVGLSSSAMAALRALEQIGIVTLRVGHDGALYHPFHDSVRQARRGHLDDGMRGRLHRGLALAHEALVTQDFEALAHHHAAVGATDEAGRYAIAAGDRAFAGLAFAAAAAHYARAIEHLPGHPAPWELHERAARSQANLGHSDRAAASFERAAVLRSEVHDWDIAATRLAAQAAEQYFHGGDVVKGYPLLRHILARLGTRLPRGQITGIFTSLYHRGMFLFLAGRGPAPTDAPLPDADALHLDALWTAATCLAHINHVLADAFLVRHVRAATRAGDRRRLVRSLAYEAAAEAALGGRFERASARQFERVELLLRPSDDAYHHGWCAACRAATAYFRARWPEVVAHAEIADRNLTRFPGTSWERAVNFGYWTFALALMAELDQLATVRRRALDDAARRNDRLGENHCRSGFGGLLWLYRDDLDTARREATGLLELDGPTSTTRAWPESSFRTPDYQNLLARVHIDLYAGEQDSAHCRLADAWPRVKRAFLPRVQFVGADLHFLYGRAALAARSIPGTLDIARRHTAALRRNSNPCAAPYAAVLAAVLSARRGRSAVAGALLETAIAGFRRLAMPAHAAAALHRLGELTSGAAGAARCDAALGELAARQIAAPARIIALFAPPL
jgi:serine/threonine protein kinase